MKLIGAASICRFDTFGDEQLWTEVLRMHEPIATVDPVSFEAPRCDRVATAFEQIEAIDQSSLPRPS
jgi:hypothetical protein